MVVDLVQELGIDSAQIDAAFGAKGEAVRETIERVLQDAIETYARFGSRSDV